MADQARRLEWSARSRQQLRDILRHYVQHASVEVAERVLNQIDRAARQIASHPHIGPMVTGLDPSYRRFQAGAYTPFYRTPPAERVVRIFAVRHGRQRPLAPGTIASLDVVI